jgi:GWxTD domain-containing protein
MNIFYTFLLLVFFTNPCFCQIDSSSAVVQYLFTKKQQHEYNSLQTITEKEEYINSFWKSFAGLGNPENIRTEFNKRAESANKKFTTNNLEGWQTDQGRVLIIYGEPDEIYYSFFDDRINLPDNLYEFKDSEIWFFDQPKGNNEIPDIFKSIDDGRVFFVFLKKQPGALEQIYATEENEKIDPAVYYTRMPIMR